MEERKISAAVIRRLPRYFRYLSDLHEQQVERISSKQLSELMGLTASQIRQDLNNFGEFGLQGYGYNVNYLRDEIRKVLGMDKINNMVLVGLGNLGQAILRYNGFAGKGFIFRAAFDRNPTRIGTEIGDLRIRNINELNEYLDSHDVDIVVLTVPKGAAQDIVDSLGERNLGIWNFASMDLVGRPGLTIENVHLSESLMRLSYCLKHERKMDE